MRHFYRTNPGTGVVTEVTPESAGWKYLSFRVVVLKAGEAYREETGANEVALVPLNGKASVDVSGEKYDLERDDVFNGVACVLYAPPGKQITVRADTDFRFTTGSAPATGRYPTRLFRAGEIRQEVRGGGASLRQVNHILSYPLPAERLILYEVYVPGGMWSGWPPHRHDGDGAPYLEETYYYQFQPDNGFGIQRNYRDDEGFDELFTVKSGDTATVNKGYHPVACAPGANMYFLNYQAGDLVDEARGTPPYEDPAHVWIKSDWTKNVLQLPIGGKNR